MESLHLNSKKSSKVKNILITILILVIFGLGGFVYSRVVEIKDENNKFQNLLEQSQKDLKALKESKAEKKDFDIKNKTIVQEIEYISYFNIIISKNGDAYLEVSKNYKEAEEESPEIKAGLAEIQKQYKDYKIDGYESVDKTNTLKSVKLPITDVVSAYKSAGGLAVGDIYILFIKSDGTISALLTGDILNGKINVINNVDNLKNIVSITTSDLKTIAIDNTGKQYVLDFNMSKE